MVGNSGRLVPVSRPGTLTEAVASQLIRLINEGHFKPGERLPPEPELAAQLQVGRGTVREILTALDITGLVRVQKGKGTFVGDPSSYLIRPVTLGLRTYVDLQSFLEVRMALEVLTASLAAERASAEDLRLIESSLAKFREGLHAESIQRAQEGDAGFHFALAQASHNPVLIQLMNLLRDQLTTVITDHVPSVKTPLGANPAARKRGFHLHMGVYHAIHARKPQAARRAMERLIARSWPQFFAKKQRQTSSNHRGLQGAG